MREFFRFLGLPLRALGALVGLVGRLAAAVVASALMTAGLVVWLKLGLPAVGLPLIVLGLLLAARAVF